MDYLRTYKDCYTTFKVIYRIQSFQNQLLAEIYGEERSYKEEKEKNRFFGDYQKPRCADMVYMTCCVMT